MDSTIKGKIIERLTQSWFVPYEMCKWLDQDAKVCYCITFENTIIKIYSDLSVDDITINNIANRVTHICQWIKAIANVNSVLDIEILLTPYKKHLDTDLGYYQVNSGMSCVSDDQNFVIIFRQEEIYKVLIHELIHNMGLDFAGNSLDHLTTHIKLGKNSRPILLNEAYVEIISNYLHSLFYSYKHKVSFKKILQDEHTFSIIQANKIMNYFNIKTIKYFSKRNSFVQYTNIVPYYIIKCHLMFFQKVLVLNFLNKKRTKHILSVAMDMLFYKEMYNNNFTSDDNSLKMIKYDFI